MHAEELKHRRSAAEPRSGVAVGSEQLVAALQQKWYLEVVYRVGCLHDWAWRIYCCNSVNLSLVLIVFCSSIGCFKCLAFFGRGKCLLTLSPSQCQTSLLSYVWSLKYYPTFQALAFHILIFCLLSSYLWHEHYIQGHGRRSICINSS